MAGLFSRLANLARGTLLRARQPDDPLAAALLRADLADPAMTPTPSPSSPVPEPTAPDLGPGPPPRDPGGFARRTL